MAGRARAGILVEACVVVGGCALCFVRRRRLRTACRRELGWNVPAGARTASKLVALFPLWLVSAYECWLPATEFEQQQQRQRQRQQQQQWNGGQPHTARWRSEAEDALGASREGGGGGGPGATEIGGCAAPIDYCARTWMSGAAQVTNSRSAHINDLTPQLVLWSWSRGWTFTMSPWCAGCGARETKVLSAVTLWTLDGPDACRCATQSQRHWRRIQSPLSSNSPASCFLQT